jgi:hypothetical protein
LANAITDGISTANNFTDKVSNLFSNREPDKRTIGITHDLANAIQVTNDISSPNQVANNFTYKISNNFSHGKSFGITQRITVESASRSI